jgi:Holliday junction DNA helicase RuvA
MLARIFGKIVGTESNAVIIDAAGVGYRVHTTNEALLTSLATGDSCALWTHLAVRENALELYGFIERSDLDFFTLLLSVSGIGPKSALTILNLAPPRLIQQAIVSGDTTYLTKVAGIGKKNAEKIVLELKDKVKLSDSEGAFLPDTEALQALEALGYPLGDAREALKRVSAEATTVEARIKFALRELGNK